MRPEKGVVGDTEEKDASEGSLPGEGDAYTRIWRVRKN